MLASLENLFQWALRDKRKAEFMAENSHGSFGLDKNGAEGLFLMRSGSQEEAGKININVGLR